jgi:hypothetical protein
MGFGFSSSLAIVVLAASCTTAPWVDTTVEGLHFSHPAEWQVQTPKGERPFGLHSTPVLYLANFVIGPECVQGATRTTTCGQAIRRLQDGDVVIAWWHESGRGAFLPEGPQLFIHGREARLLLDGAPHICDGADVEAWLAIRMGPDQVEQFRFCSRGVDAQESRSAFQRFIGSISFPGTSYGR